MPKQASPYAYWSQSIDTLLAALRSSPDGLSAAYAREHLAQIGPNVLETRRRVTALGLFLGQLKSPLVLILVFAVVVSAVVQEWVDAAIVLVWVPASNIIVASLTHVRST